MGIATPRNPLRVLTARLAIHHGRSAPGRSYNNDNKIHLLYTLGHEEHTTRRRQGRGAMRPTMTTTALAAVASTAQQARERDELARNNLKRACFHAHQDGIPTHEIARTLGVTRARAGQQIEDGRRLAGGVG